MIFKKKANNIYAFESEEDLKNFCADNKSESVCLHVFKFSNSKV